MTESNQGRIVEAEQFILRDKDGNSRAQLSVTTGGSPTLTFYDSDERERIVIALAAAQEGGLISDQHGEMSVQLNELAGCPFVALLDPTRKGGTVLAAGLSGPFLAMYDEKGSVRAQLDVTGELQRVMFHDVGGKVRAVLAVTKDGPTLSLFDADGSLMFTAPDLAR